MELPASAAARAADHGPGRLDTANDRIDCAEESAKGRRSLCYDRKALDARKAKEVAIDCAAEDAAARKAIVVTATASA